MKRLKKLDLFIQAILFVATGLILLVQPTWLYLGYLLLATWQIAGVIYHQLKGIYTGKLMPRYCYHRALLLISALAIIAPLLPFKHLLYHTIAAAIPLLAVVYGYICYKETFRYMVRPLELV